LTNLNFLLAIELRDLVTAQLTVDMSVFELMEGRTIADVAEVVAKKCRPVANGLNE
jgi:hypothetical protein